MESASKNKKILNELKAAWLRQLYKDYRNLLWRHGYGKISPASIELMKNKMIWGRWDADNKRILINEDLILKHSWEAVLGILGHEVAHQLVSELGAEQNEQEAPHGARFKKFGQSLGLDDFFLRAAVELREHTPQNENFTTLSGESRKVLEKVKKILALSGSPNEGEAQAALKAAARLMSKYKIEFSDKGRMESAPQYEARLIKLGKRKIDCRLALISRILRQHFFVENIFVPTYDPHTDTEVKCLEIMGRPENIHLAEHVYHFLMERSEKLWNYYRLKHPGGGNRARNSFIINLLEAFDLKLKQVAKGGQALPGEGICALIPTHDKALQNFVQMRHPRTRTLKPGRGRRHCEPSGKAGQKAGKSLNFNPPIEEGTARKREIFLLSFE